MTPQTEFLELICKTAEEHCELASSISLEELPPAGGLYAELGEGFGQEMYYDKRAIRTMPVLFMCRDADQQRGMEQLCRICNYLQSQKKYPQGEQVSWLNSTVTKDANKIGRDEDGKFYFSCIVNCQVYF